MRTVRRAECPGMSCTKLNHGNDNDRIPSRLSVLQALTCPAWALGHSLFGEWRASKWTVFAGQPCTLRFGACFCLPLSIPAAAFVLVLHMGAKQSANMSVEFNHKEGVHADQGMCIDHGRVLKESATLYRETWVRCCQRRQPQQQPQALFSPAFPSLRPCSLGVGSLTLWILVACKQCWISIQSVVLDKTSSFCVVRDA